MQRRLTIEIDAGETTCDGCELFRQVYQIGPECRKFGVLKIKNYIAGQCLSYNSERHHECLAAEQREERWGCHCDLEHGMEPDECVFDTGNLQDCICTEKFKRREDCEYWRKVSK